MRLRWRVPAGTNRGRSIVRKPDRVHISLIVPDRYQVCKHAGLCKRSYYRQESKLYNAYETRALDSKSQNVPACEVPVIAKRGGGRGVILAILERR